MAQIDLEAFKQEKLPPSWPRGLFFFSLTVFIIVFGIFAFLNYFWLPKEEVILSDLKKEFLKIRNEFPLEKEEEVIIFEKRLNLLKSLLDQHPYLSKALVKLEEITHPQVYYTNFEFDRSSNLLKLQGVAQNQYVVSEAINGFVNHPEIIKAVIVRDIKTNQDKTVNFSIELSLNQNIFKFE